MLIVLLGPPGAGKGTHGERLSKALKVPCLSTGNMLRHAVSEHSELGETVKQYLDIGALVPDEIVCAIIEDYLQNEQYKNGLILDGFPRNLHQAVTLEEIRKVDHAVFIDVSDDAIVKRMGGRRSCEHCGTPYHLEYNRPHAEGICDKCGHRLSMREDDKPELVLERLRVYHEMTEPVKDFYSRIGVLRMVEGQEGLEETTRLVFAAVGIE